MPEIRYSGPVSSILRLIRKAVRLATSSPRLLIRADASREFGTGHVMRCLAIGQEWKKRGGGVSFASAENLPELENRLAAEGFTFLRIPAARGSAADAAWITAKLEGEPQFLLLDGYCFNDSFLSSFWGRALGVAVLDDCGDFRGGLPYVLVNNNISADAALYGSGPAKVLLGTEYSLIRREFLESSRATPESRGEKANLLVTMGGGDPNNATLRVVKALKSRQAKLDQAVFVLGAGHPDPASVEREIAGWGANAKVVKSAGNMAELIREATLAVCASGSTLWEMCYFGLPPLVFTLFENQNGIAACLAKTGFATDCGGWNSFNEDRFIRELTPLIEDPQLRMARSVIGQRLVDGRGAARVVDALLAQSR
jgi:UDP-2,4-diacetamido-2,4,6-trideoxy-beta-L-altropyranose hydrolase